MRTTLLTTMLLTAMCSTAQFAPAAGQPGSDAIQKDSSIIVGWATSCLVQRGWVNAADTTMMADGDVHTSFGSAENAVGPASGNVTDVVSLGDGGMATLSFSTPISDGPGPDIAVFENSFSNDFLELAFVEVSSDGVNFVRFPSTSLTQDTLQLGPFGLLEPSLVDGLAGKYVSGYGVPFDLAVLSDSLLVDINQITHVRVVDVVGTIGPLGTFDSQGNRINDPFPTSFASGGFDLDGVAVLDQVAGLDETPEQVLFYPNPSEGPVKLAGIVNGIEVFSLAGRLIFRSSEKIETIDLDSGHYLIHLRMDEGLEVWDRLHVR